MSCMLEIVDYGKGIDAVVDAIRGHIANRTSFSVVNVAFGRQSLVVSIIENEAESAGLNCRVRTANRGWAAAALTVASMGWAAAAGVAIAAHSLATKNPKVEIVKEMIGSDVAVEFVK